jgi:two-component system sensor histidine kinase VicK
LRYDGPTKDVPVLADKISIKEVLNNLIANAIRYTSAGGTVTVKLVAGSEKIVTTVRDSGIGIPANALPHLFTKFFRVHGGLESGSGGTGLGLYISKSIVELHSGRIWVESVEGQGSTFGFTLPPFNETRYQAEIANRPKILKGPHA